MRRRTPLARRLVLRLREPSSLAGLSALALLLGAAVDQAQQLSTIAAAVLGVLAVLVPESGNDDR